MRSNREVTVEKASSNSFTWYTLEVEFEYSHATPPLRQFEQSGCCRSHLTLRVRHWVQGGPWVSSSSRGRRRDTETPVEPPYVDKPFCELELLRLGGMAHRVEDGDSVKNKMMICKIGRRCDARSRDGLQRSWQTDSGLVLTYAYYLLKKRSYCVHKSYNHVPIVCYIRRWSREICPASHVVVHSLHSSPFLGPIGRPRISCCFLAAEVNS
jgi:hypothetical protein